MKTDKDDYLVVGLGEILWDMLPDGKKLGGAPTNFAYHAHCLGAQGYLVSSVGNDYLGKEILDNIDKLELNRDFVSVNSDYPTGTVTVELDDKGTPNYIIHENVAWDFIPSSNKLLEFAPTVDAVCFGSLCQRSEISKNTVKEFLNATRNDCLRIFDINIRQHYYSKNLIENMLCFSNIFKLNDIELVLVANLLGLNGSEIDVLKALIECFSLRLIALTKSADGSVLFGDGVNSVICPEPIDIVDTVGAGDAFTAALAVSLLQNRSLHEIHKYANRLAAFVCSQSGATPKLPKELTEYN